MRPKTAARGSRERSRRSELGLLRLLVRLDGLHHAQAALLDVLLRVVALLLALLVLVLQALEQLLQILLGLGHLRVLLLDRLGQVGHGHGHVLVERGLLLLVAELRVRRPAARAQVLLGKIAQTVKVAPAFIVVQVVRVARLEGGEALDAHLVALALALASAVHIRHEDARVVGVLLHELVPVRLHALAVATPGSVELHEDRLAGGLGVPRVLRELDGACLRGSGKNQGHVAQRHVG
mmetsp:Transcript_118335/g.232334  ORF Transcript_118335/g.232334 Transcript_118335/m.232334 type:complete len:237 (-) Transcript_118335:93-803(-)